jgi:hypothetical protein
MFRDTNLITNDEYYESVKEFVTCHICSGILNEPVQCGKCEFYFCKGCLDEWLNQKNCCPFRCAATDFHPGGRVIKNMLSKLLSFCALGCYKKLRYEEVEIHHSVCKSEKWAIGSQLEKLRAEHEEFKKRYTDLAEGMRRLKLMRERERVKEEETLSQIKELKNTIVYLEQKLRSHEGEENRLEILNPQMRNLNRDLEEIFCEPRSHFEFSNEQYITHDLDPRIKIFITDCHHLENHKFLPMCSECSKAYPCIGCHNNRNSHNFVPSQKVLCESCYGIKTYDSNDQFPFSCEAIHCKNNRRNY